MVEPSLEQTLIPLNLRSLSAKFACGKLMDLENFHASIVFPLFNLSLLLSASLNKVESPFLGCLAPCLIEINNVALEKKVI